MSWLGDTLRRVTDVALDVGKVVGTVIAPFNPILGGAIAGGSFILDRVTDFEKAPSAPTPITSGGMMGGSSSSFLPPSITQNLPGGNFLSSLFGSTSKIPTTGGILPGQLSVVPGTTGGFGLPRGPGGSLQAPWSDPRIPDFLKQFAIDDRFLRNVPRAPAGYVVLRDASGRPFGVLKQVAKAFKLWSPKQRPPISVKDWNALKRGCSTVRKMQRVAKMANALGKRKKLAIC